MFRFKEAIKAAIDFEKELAITKTTWAMPQEEVDELTQMAKKPLGSRRSRYEQINQ